MNKCGHKKEELEGRGGEVQLLSLCVEKCGHGEVPLRSWRRTEARCSTT